jgi:hypothetical protein
MDIKRVSFGKANELEVKVDETRIKEHRLVTCAKTPYSNFKIITLRTDEELPRYLTLILPDNPETESRTRFGALVVRNATFNGAVQNHITYCYNFAKYQMEWYNQN